LFLNTILEFIIVAFAIFLVVRSVNRMRAPAPAPPPAPASKECSFCRMSVPLNATRCPHCTSQLAGTATV
jgi:large conductance mechanosensitive channel